DGLGDALLRAGEEVLAVRCRAEAPVKVHPDHVHVLAAVVGGLDGLGCAQADTAGDREDDVRALADEGVPDALASAEVGEAAGEGALLGFLAPSEDRD